MQITTLVENLVYQKNLNAEHGLSFYIEIDDRKILFDVGQSDNYINNAKHLGIDLSSVDYLIISHGHYDHIGGLKEFLEFNKKATIIAKAEAFFPKYKYDKNIGFNNEIKIPKSRIKLIESSYYLMENVVVIGNIENVFPIDQHYEGFYTIQNGIKKKDTFNDELFICLLDKEVTVLSSCSHNGITNIIETSEKIIKTTVNNVIGGFHCNNSNEKTINHIIEYLKRKKINNIGICHCTGIENFPIFKREIETNVFYNYTGKKIEF